MTMEANTGLNVSNHYGPREVGGTDGVMASMGAQRTYVVDVEGDKPLYRDIIVPAGAMISNIETTGTAAVTTLVVGTQDISTATYGTTVTVTDAGALEGTFTGTGKVVVTAQVVVA